MSIAKDGLAERTGVAPEMVADWISMGLVESDEDGSFGEEAAERVRLLKFLDESGVAARDVAGLSEADGDVLGRWAHWFEPLRPVGRTLREAAGDIDMDVELVRRIWIAAGLADQVEVFDEDVGMLLTFRAALDIGVPEDMLLQLVRVSSDALGRVAEAEVRLFHFHVHERLRAQGLSGVELEDEVQAIGDALVGTIEPTVLYWHRKGWRRALLDDMLLHARQGVADPVRIAELPIAVLFIDLAGFTPLTEAMGDRVAAQILDRFSQMVRKAAADHHGRVLKQIGDEFMIAFSSADAAVKAGLALAAVVAAESEFPGLRMGTHVGAALYREADYLGASINIAARVAAEATRGQFLATVDVKEAADVAGVRWVPRGSKRLKGMTDAIDLYEILPAEDVARRPVDPICGMQVDPATCEHTTRWSDEEYFFCSSGCFERFVDEPQRDSDMTD